MNKVKSFVPVIILLLIVIAVGAGGYFLYTNTDSSPTNLVESDKYQAVFLSNGQVYFGKVKNLSKQYAEMSEIYYLIIQSPLQQQKPVEGEATPPQTPEYTLVKLGEELHGPMDKMVINRDHILFVEDLNENGKVSTAIIEYKAENGL